MRRRCGPSYKRRISDSLDEPTEGHYTRSRAANTVGSRAKANEAAISIMYSRVRDTRTTGGRTRRFAAEPPTVPLLQAVRSVWDGS